MRKVGELMGFSTTYKGRKWLVTMQVSALLTLGYKAEDFAIAKEWTQEQLLELSEKVYFYITEQINSEVALVICISEQGLFHLHVAIYTSNTTTLKRIADITNNSHTEPQLGKKENLLQYLRKEGEFAEKGEIVLYEYNLQAVQDTQGKRNDLESIELALNAGLTPKQIFEKNIYALKYKQIVLSAFLQKRIKETPLHKQIYNEWHTGPAGSGKSYTFIKLCERYGEDNVFFANCLSSLDKYNECCSDIVFWDELKPYSLTYQQLLSFSDSYGRAQTHCRYENCYNIWSKFYISSIYAPEQFYEEMVSETKRNIDTFKQLIRRFNRIVYHYKNEDGEYKEVAICGKEYKNIGQLENLAIQQEAREQALKALGIKTATADSLEEFNIVATANNNKEE